MAVEIEIKLRIDDDETVRLVCEDLAVDKGRMEAWRDVRMRSIYFDTLAHDLFKRKWTLRRRFEDDASIITFKQMGFQEESLFSREEWQIPGTSIEAAIPTLVHRGAPRELLELSGFVERCSVTFIRHTTKLRLPEGSVVELAIDRGHIRAGDKTEPMLELELELLSGEPEEMVGLAASWESSYRLSKEYHSKYMRALRLLESGESEGNDG